MIQMWSAKYRLRADICFSVMLTRRTHREKEILPDKLIKIPFMAEKDLKTCESILISVSKN